jgi:hypothetical protein
MHVMGNLADSSFSYCESTHVSVVYIGSDWYLSVHMDRDISC